MIAIRSIFKIAAGALLLASCATAERGDDTDADRGLDELATIPKLASKAVCSQGLYRCNAHVRVGDDNAIKPFAAPQGLAPADLVSAYKIPSGGAGVTVAIVDAFHYPNVESDLATYRSQFGLPACTKANGCLKVVNDQGTASPVPANSPAGDDWTVEAALDLDMVSAACPNCKILFIEAKDDSSNSLFTSNNTAATASLNVKAVSNSWGGPDGSAASLETNFNHAGISYFASSGDSGNVPTQYPADSAFVTAVGGTSLVKSTSAARGWTEGAWSSAGSSCSTAIAKPSFETQTVCAKRASADVSAVANPNTGAAVFNAGSGGWIVVGGTSLASPLVAGIYAASGVAGNGPSYAWGHTNQFFDVTTGSNGSCSSKLCKAGAGWDGPTGLGTPNGALLGGTTTCTPSCSGKTCGGDGCGGSCGTCATGQTCTAAGTCVAGNTCAHSDCSTGGKLASGCDPCVTQICAADSFCCNSSWDSICVGEVSSVCHQNTCAPAPPPTPPPATCAHDKCNTGGKLTATCDTCVGEICAADSFCCNNSWDSVCVGEVSSVCGDSCN